MQALLHFDKYLLILPDIVFYFLTKLCLYFYVHLVPQWTAEGTGPGFSKSIDGSVPGVMSCSLHIHVLDSGLLACEYAS